MKITLHALPPELKKSLKFQYLEGFFIKDVQIIIY